MPRSVAQLRLSCRDPPLSPAFPRGPWATHLLALEEINAYCKNIKTDGGGFVVIIESRKDGNATHGARVKLVCNQHKQGCKWQLWLERCVEGWVLFESSRCGGHFHTHDLVQSREEANAHTSMRSIPDKFVDTATTMVSAGVRVATVFRWLRHMVEGEGDEVAFNYQDVNHATGASTAQRLLDASDLVETLRRREQDEGLFYRMLPDGDGALNAVFFAMRGAHEMYAVDVERQVVELDTKVGCCGAALRCAALPAPPPHRHL